MRDPLSEGDVGTAKAKVIKLTKLSGRESLVIPRPTISYVAPSRDSRNAESSAFHYDPGPPKTNIDFLNAQLESCINQIQFIEHQLKRYPDIVEALGVARRLAEGHIKLVS